LVFGPQNLLSPLSSRSSSLTGPQSHGPLVFMFSGLQFLQPSLCSPKSLRELHKSSVFSPLVSRSLSPAGPQSSRFTKKGLQVFESSDLFKNRSSSFHAFRFRGPPVRGPAVSWALNSKFGLQTRSLSVFEFLQKPSSLRVFIFSPCGLMVPQPRSFLIFKFL
jgi:hypothetical protein